LDADHPSGGPFFTSKHIPTGCANGIGRTRLGCLTSHAGHEPMSHTHPWTASRGRCSSTLGSAPRTCPAISGNGSHGRGTDCQGSVEPVGISIRSSCPGARRCQRMTGFPWERHSPEAIRAPLEFASACQLPRASGCWGGGDPSLGGGNGARVGIGGASRVAAAPTRWGDRPESGGTVFPGPVIVRKAKTSLVVSPFRTAMLFKR
jgi:hypothetical protein